MWYVVKFGECTLNGMAIIILLLYLCCINCIENNSGPRMDPRGTPILHRNVVDLNWLNSISEQSESKQTRSTKHVV